MLKSTYRAEPAVSLPAGWTEHKAPSGHTYYYHAETKKSTYTRPVEEPEGLQIDYNATAPDQVMQASLNVLQEFHKNNPENQRGQGQFTGGRSYQDRHRQDKRQDKPKSKRPIANFEPWILVMTKFGRRFVHNTETKESFWKFPADVMMAVIEMERSEWEMKQKAEREKTDEPQEELNDVVPTRERDKDAPGRVEDEFDSDEYEEVEVTDDEDEGSSVPKRPRIDEDQPTAPTGPVEYDEDDIAWQLAHMEEDNLAGDDHYDYNGDQPGEEDDEEGLPLTSEDTVALFRSLLDETQINPFSPFDALIESANPLLIEDDRWVTLPNMSSRRAAFKSWSRDRIAEQKLQEAARAAVTRKKEPRVVYLDFLQENATAKLYWPEFKRKFKKENALKDLNLSDKERERLYREYITKLKLSESDRKRELVALLKGTPSDSSSWNRRTKLGDVPDTLLRDLRYYVVRDREVRDSLVEAHIATLRG